MSSQLVANHSCLHPSVCRARGRPRATSVRFLVAAFVLLGACQEVTPAPTATASSSTAGSRFSSGIDITASSATDPGFKNAANTSTCSLAIRSASGGYARKFLSVLLAEGLASGSSDTALFVYRGWSPESQVPAVIATCPMPDTPAARAYLSGRFGSKVMSSDELRALATLSGLPTEESWGTATSRSAQQGTHPVYVTDGLVSQARISQLEAPAAGPPSVGIANVPIPPDSDYVPTDPPDPSPYPSEVTIPGFGPYTSVTCRNSTDLPHLSTTTGYVGNINVHSWSTCTAPIYQWVQASLKREHCFATGSSGYFYHVCQFETIAQSLPYSNTAFTVEQVANTTCAWQISWYRGEGDHKQTYNYFTVPSHTVSADNQIRCW